MKLHISDLWSHAPHQELKPEVQSNGKDVLYATILVLGIPAVVMVTIYMVRYLYAGMIWLIPG